MWRAGTLHFTINSRRLAIRTGLIESLWRCGGGCGDAWKGIGRGRVGRRRDNDAIQYDDLIAEMIYVDRFTI
jgi:hypothetical protein